MSNMMNNSASAAIAATPFSFVITAPAASNADSDFQILDEGAYPAMCVALVAKQMDNFDRTAKENRIQFVFQVVEGDTKHYIRSMPVRVVNNEKSNLTLLLQSWTKRSPEQLTGFNLMDCLGKPAQIVVAHELSKDKSKTYTRLANVLAAKKSDANMQVTPDAMPAFIGKDNIGIWMAPGITLAEPKAASAQAPATAVQASPVAAPVAAPIAQVAPTPGFGNPAIEDDDNLPF